MYNDKSQAELAYESGKQWARKGKSLSDMDVSDTWAWHDVDFYRGYHSVLDMRAAQDFVLPDGKDLVKDTHEYLNRVLTEIKCDLAEQAVFGRAARLLAEMLANGVIKNENQ